MFYLTMTILTAIGLTIGLAVFTSKKEFEIFEYTIIGLFLIMAALVWPLTIFTVILGGLFWYIRNLMNKTPVEVGDD